MLISVIVIKSDAANIMKRILPIQYFFKNPVMTRNIILLILWYLSIEILLQKTTWETISYVPHFYKVRLRSAWVDIRTLKGFTRKPKFFITHCRSNNTHSAHKQNLPQVELFVLSSCKFSAVALLCQEPHTTSCFLSDFWKQVKQINKTSYRNTHIIVSCF